MSLRLEELLRQPLQIRMSEQVSPLVFPVTQSAAHRPVIIALLNQVGLSPTSLPAPSRSPQRQIPKSTIKQQARQHSLQLLQDHSRQATLLRGAKPMTTRI